MVIFEVSGEKEERSLLAKYVRHHLGGFCSDAEDYGRGSAPGRVWRLCTHLREIRS
jgi:hypothetical protein